jgi:hypothetical protein
MRQFVVEVAAGLLLLVMGAYIGARMVRNEYALGWVLTKLSLIVTQSTASLYRMV